MLPRASLKLYWAAGVVTAILGLIFYLNIVPKVHRVITTPDKAEIWSYVQVKAREHSLSPEFVYAIIFAESSFDPHADVGYARGLMQISKGAWTTVETSSWDNAFQWKANIDAGTAYMVYLRDQLTRNGHFSYPLLAASYRYGFGTVKQANYNIANLTRPQNSTYQALFAGNESPITPPRS